MSPREVYQSREAEFSDSAGRLQKLSDRLSMARLGVFVGGLILFAILLSVSLITAVATLSVALILFAWMVIRYETTEEKRKRFLHLAEINKLEMKCLDGDFSGYKSGEEYIERDHPYSYDLDIFGKASLFQYICRTTSRPASDLLAEYLKQSAAREEILRRQEAVAELQPLTDWRQELMTLGYLNAGAGNDPAPLMQWLASNDLFRKTGREKIITGCLSLLALASVILVITGLPAAILAPVFGVNFIFYFTRFKKISKLQEQVSRSSDLLKAYSEIIRLIEDRDFAAPLLQDLQSHFKGEISASQRIRQLSKLVGRLDSRLNVLVSIPLNLLFFTDIHFCLALERWKREHAQRIAVWFAAMAELEVLASLANMAFNNHDWVFPEVTDDYFVLRAEMMGHPLIPAGRRISNDFSVEGPGQAIVITGSNMSGKSTFLRTCGINAVLAFAGAPVCASAFTVSLVRLHSSMRISDSLEENISSFYAELRRLRAIISGAETDPKVFLLLDEILRGTNSDDRYTGSVALIKQLTGYGSVAMVATHDLRLAGLEKDLPDNIENYHFDVKVNDEELFFDYRLTPGVCSSFNASLLMKKMGIRV
jgi:ABC-type multidrug transport system fused ATPase/permease subunit